MLIVESEILYVTDEQGHFKKTFKKILRKKPLIVAAIRSYILLCSGKSGYDWSLSKSKTSRKLITSLVMRQVDLMEPGANKT